MYLGSWKIDDVLTFACNTHTPSTGSVTDADAVPSYRVYEDETGTPILTGSTAKLDDAGTTGFYSEQITLSAANGLEKGKTYTIRLSAAVGGITGTMSHTFQMEAEVDANIVSDTSVAQASTALTNVTWTDAKAAFIDHAISTVDTNVDTLLARITAARAGYLDNLSAGAVALASALATAQTDLDTITGADGVTLATLQALYAPNKVIPDVAGTAATLHGITDGKIDTVDSNVDSILVDTGTDGVLLAATATSAQLVDDVWDEIITGAVHNTPTSAGRRLLELGAYHISSGTAQAGATYSITLDAGETAGNYVLNRNLIVIQVGTGAGQTRTIVNYNSTSKVAVVDRDWHITPDATSEYSIIPDDTPLVANHGVASAGTSTTITIQSNASSISSTYSDSIIQIMAGTGSGQSYLIDTYNGTTNVVTICGTWTTTPDNTSVYVILPYGVSNVCNIGTDALALINTECDTALSDYGANTTVPDAAGTAATLHGTTDGKVDAIQTDATAILLDTGTTIPGTITTLQTDSTAIKAKTDNLPDGIKKNTAITAFTFLMVDSTDHVTAKTGLTVAGNLSGDGGAVAALTNTAAITEISNGLYEIDLTQGELNYDNVTLIFTATGADARLITIHTST